MSSYLAFDLGASSGRAILGRFDGQRITMHEVHRFATPTIVEGERLYWNLEEVWTALQEGLRRALAVEPDLRSLSIDSWGVDYVPMDRAMAPLRRAHVYRDPRTNGMEAVARALITEDALYGATGIRSLFINTLFQVLADRELTPAVFDNTRCRLLVADYFNWRFCGHPTAEVSLASTTQLLDPVTQDWSVAVMRTLGIDPETWPGVVPSGTVLGPVDWAQNVMVIAGCSHDTACAVAAVPVVEETSWAYLSSGTWSLLGVEQRVPLCTPAARAAGFTNEIGYGGTIRLLKNLTGLWVLQECERVWREAGQSFDYDTLLHEAESAKPVSTFIDFNEPVFSTRGDMPRRIANWCIANGAAVPEDRGAYVRLILESLAEMYRTTLADLESLLGKEVKVLHVVGGGSRNTLLNQWTANRCRCNVIAGPAEATALGNLLVQASTMGDLPAGTSLRMVAARSADLKTFRPTQSAGS